MSLLLLFHGNPTLPPSPPAVVVGGDFNLTRRRTRGRTLPSLDDVLQYLRRRRAQARILNALALRKRLLREDDEIIAILAEDDT